MVNQFSDLRSAAYALGCVVACCGSTGRWCADAYAHGMGDQEKVYLDQLASSQRFGGWGGRNRNWNSCTESRDQIFEPYQRECHCNNDTAVFCDAGGD